MIESQYNHPDLSLLSSPFQEKARELSKRCTSRGVEIRFFSAVRGPVFQAQIWKQSRSEEEILRTVKRFRQEGAEYLASLIEDVGPRYGRWATNNPPGFSWHQWQEALDAYVVSDTKKAIWKSDYSGYAVYAEEAVRLGLTAGYYWSHRDAQHVQLRNQEVRDVYTLEEIDREMQKRFTLYSRV